MRCRPTALSSWSRWLAKWLGFAAVTVTVPATGATRYVFATFKGDSAESEKLSVYTSADGLNFTLLSNTGYAGPTGVLRDPSVMKHTDGQYYVAYTLQSWTTTSSSFAIAKSSDLTHWTFLVEVPAQVSAVKDTWAPEWFKDTDGSVHLIISVDTTNTAADFQPYLYSATNDSLTEWSAPQPLGIGTNYIDTFVVNVGGTYHAFCKNESTKYIEHASAAKLLGPWTFKGTGDWMGWGSGKEGPALFQLDNGDWRMFLDCYSGCGYLYTTSSDLVSWTATATVPSGLSGVRHGTVLREESGTGGANGTGGRSSSGVSTTTSAGGTQSPGGASGVGGTKVASGGTSPSSAGGTKSAGGTNGTGTSGVNDGTSHSGGVNGTGGGSSNVQSLGGRSAVAAGGQSGPSTVVPMTGGTSAASSSTTGAVISSGGLSNAGGSMRTGGTSSNQSTSASGGVTSNINSAGVPTSGGVATVSTTTSNGDSPARSDRAGGCNCSVPNGSAHGSWLWALLAAAGCIRRRSDSRQR